MRPPFGYFGGKATHLQWLLPIVEGIEHRVYTEAFAGSLAVLLAKTPAPVEVVNDLDRGCAAWWRALRDWPDELERACALTPWSRAEWEACADVDADGLEVVERARRWWVRVTQAHGRATTGGWSTGDTGTTHRASTVLASLDRFAPLAARMRRVVIECDDAAALIARYDAADALHYVDPPYLGETRSRGTAGYRLDMRDAEQHAALLQVLTAAKGHVLLAGYPSALYAETLTGWDMLQVPTRRGSASRAGTGGAAGVEVLWSNRPLVEAPTQPSLLAG